MRELNVYLEIEGKPVLVGCISGNSFVDAVFCYAKEYISRPDSRAISVNLPLNEEKFSPAQTRIFFEGLLPEGFSRRAVANWAKVNEEDYLAILARLGRECLGALLILEKGETWQEGEYQKLSEREVAA